MKAALVLLLITPLGPAVPQDNVLPVFGCGTGCRVETEQLSLPERMPDGWLRIKVRQRTWVQNCDWTATPVTCVDEPASGRAGPPVQDLWLFADCACERFATSLQPTRSNAWEQDVFYGIGSFDTMDQHVFIESMTKSRSKSSMKVSMSK